MQQTYGPRNYHTKYDKCFKDKYHDIAPKQKLKIQMNYLENRNKLTDIEYKLMVTKEEGSGQDKLGV